MHLEPSAGEDGGEGAGSSAPSYALLQRDLLLSLSPARRPAYAAPRVYARNAQGMRTQSGAQHHRERAVQIKVGVLSCAACVDARAPPG